jgi:tRNA pseudouridine55 synthase
MDGVLNLNKPAGMTSHDVVQRARALLKVKRIGHTGTLDPLATGVLVLCVGKATRIAQYLEAGEKEYRAVMRLGMTTDTLDAEGSVLETRSYTPPDQQTIIEVFQNFIGTIMQRPPVYSAVKIRGVPSYRLAREGRAKPLEPRPVKISSIELLAYDDPFVSIAVTCSKGVYIRSLCAEIGITLGMGAHLTGLERTRSGRFRLEQAITLQELADLAGAGKTSQVVTPIDAALGDFPLVSVSEIETIKVLHGNQISCPRSFADHSGDLVRLHSPSGTLLALARIVSGLLKPDIVFC